jgi:hypothetical protein
MNRTNHRDNHQGYVPVSNNRQALVVQATNAVNGIRKGRCSTNAVQSK